MVNITGTVVNMAGIPKSAEIELNGLTTITGLNDTGKSFISKGIFSIIKTLNESDGYVTLKRVNLVGNIVAIDHPISLQVDHHCP